MAIPRSTSVEYEAQTQSSTSRRLPGPPGPQQPRHRTGASASRKPISTARSGAVVNGRPINPDISHEERGRSPINSAVDSAVQGISQVAFYVRQRSTEPNTSNSYDYSQEEREVQERTRQRAHKKGKISEDNKAYNPTSEDEFEDDYLSDDGKRKKRKKQVGVGGPLTSLPRIAPDKARKKKSKKRPEQGGEDEDDAGASGSDNSVRYGLVSPHIFWLTFVSESPARNIHATTRSIRRTQLHRSSYS